MNTTRFSQNVAKALSSIDSAKVKVDDVLKLNNAGFARVVVTVPNTLAKKAGDAVRAIENQFGNKMRAVSNSFAVTASSAATTTLTGIMTSNVQAVAYTPDMAGFRSVSGNMFLDDADSAWTLQTTAAGQVLIRARTKAEDEVIDDLMTSVSSSVVGSSSYDALQRVNADDSMRNQLSGNDFIVFVNPLTDRVSFGAVACEIVEDGEAQNLCVIASGDDQHTTIDRRMVLSVVEASEIEINDDDIYQESTSSAGHSFDEIVNYYKQVFQRDLSYFDKFITRWKNHAFQ